jgi:glucose dehydrogenase
MIAKLFLAFLLTAFCFGQTPSIALTFKSGPPKAKPFVSGSGFAPNASFGVFFDAIQLTTASTDGSGSFAKVGIEIPSSALPGHHAISAQQTPSGDSAQANFNVSTNWGQFHSDANHDGWNRHENILSAGNVGGLTLLWSYATGNPILSSPAVVNGVVYIASDTTLFALKGSTGSVLWHHTPIGGISSSSPAVANGMVYVGTGHSVQALNASTGSVVWIYPTGAVESAPTVANGVVYAGGSYFLFAIDAKTGALLWRYKGRARRLPSPAASCTKRAMARSPHSTPVQARSCGRLRGSRVRSRPRRMEWSTSVT